MNYRVTSADGTIERCGLTSLDHARRVACDLAEQTMDDVEISDEAGNTLETVAYETSHWGAP